jgi:hypothetical protein
MLNHRFPGKGMQHFRKIGIHARAFACGKDHYAHSIIQHTRPDCNLRTNLNRFTLKKLHFFHREMDRG